jgi:hypothetical protein
MSRQVNFDRMVYTCQTYVSATLDKMTGRSPIIGWGTDCDFIATGPCPVITEYDAVDIGWGSFCVAGTIYRHASQLLSTFTVPQQYINCVSIFPLDSRGAAQRRKKPHVSYQQGGPACQKGITSADTSTGCVNRLEFI